MTTETQEARDQLIDDFKKVVDDAEELLKFTANETGEKVSVVRERAEENLREARRKLKTLEDNIIVKSKAVAKATGQLVHDNPWQSVAIAGAVGLLLGMLSGRR